MPYVSEITGETTKTIFVENVKSGRIKGRSNHLLAEAQVQTAAFLAEHLSVNQILN